MTEQIKRPADVLRAIQNIEASEGFHRLIFALVEYTDAKGESDL